MRSPVHGAGWGPDAQHVRGSEPRVAQHSRVLTLDAAVSHTMLWNLQIGGLQFDSPMTNVHHLAPCIIGFVCSSLLQVTMYTYQRRLYCAVIAATMASSESTALSMPADGPCLGCHAVSILCPDAGHLNAIRHSCFDKAEIQLYPLGMEQAGLDEKPMIAAVLVSSCEHGTAGFVSQGHASM